MKDFIKWGNEFVRSLDTVDLDKDCPIEPVGHLTNSVSEVAAAGPDEQLADSVSKAPDVEKDKNAKEEMEETIAEESSSEPEEQSAEDVSKDKDEVVDTPVIKNGKSSTCSQEKRRRRLLKYHQKLVNTRGLPPSRLMQQTPGLSSDLGNIRKEICWKTLLSMRMPRCMESLSSIIKHLWQIQITSLKYRFQKCL